MPIVGLDGGMGFPGYSGLWPNGMLANSLVLTRDLLTSGSVQLELAALNQNGETKPPFWKGTESKALPSTGQSGSAQTLKRIQPNVRAVLAEMEILQGLTFPAVEDQVTAQPYKRRTAAMKFGEAEILTLSAPYRDEFIKQLDSVFNFADLRAERSAEILSQVVPQTAYWSAIAALTPERHRHTLELLGIGLRFAMMIVMKFKLLLNCPRPSEYSALVQPIILTPGYSAFPSGHATEAYFAAELIAALHLPTNKGGELLGDAGVDLKAQAAGLRGQLHRLAYRIAENRVVAGLHFPVDSLAGQWLGVALARYFVWSCTARPIPTSPPSSPKPSPAIFRHSMQFGVGKSEGVLGTNALPRLDTTFDSTFGALGETGSPANPSECYMLGLLWRQSLLECANAA